MLKGALARKVALLIGVVGLITGYYWVHKPFDLTLIATVGAVIVDSLTALLLTLAAGGVGRLVLARLSPAPLSRGERIGLEAGLGFGLMGLGALVLGLAGLFTAPTLSMLAALLLVIGLLRRTLIGWGRDAISLAQIGLPTGTGGRWVAAACLIFVGTAGMRALTPPIAWDSLAYHALAPRDYLAAGRITANPDNFYMGLSQGAEMVYAVGEALTGRDTVAGALHFAYGVLALAAIGGMVARYTDAATGWLAALLLLSSFSLWRLLGWPYVDMAVMLYGAVAFSAYNAYRESGRAGWLIVFGAIGGFAAGVKYTAGGIVVVGLLPLLWLARREWPRALILIGAAAVAAFALWAVKGILLYGNPIYPFMLNGLNWDSARSAQFSSAGWVAPSWQRVILPLSATLFGMEEAGAFMFTPNPFLLTAPFALIFVWGALPAVTRPFARDCVVTGGAYWALWTVLALLTAVGQQTRLVIMALPVAVAGGAVAAYGLVRLPRRPLDVAFIIRAAFAMVTALILLDAIRDTITARVPDYLLGALSRDAYLAHNLGSHYTAVRGLPEGATVRLMWDPRAYYCPRSVRCLGDVLLDHWVRPLREGQTPDQVFAAWRAAGETHLLLSKGGLNFYTDYDTRFAEFNRLFMPALDRAMIPVWTDGRDYTLYTWRP
jgi:hypothetical protein